jgi:hypothetical protein
MNRDLVDELIQEWVKMGSLNNVETECVPETVRGYIKQMTEGRVYLQKLIDHHKTLVPVADIKRIPDQDLDWRLGEIAMTGAEVMVIRVRKGANVFGKWVEAHEGRPASEEWGEFGWTYTKASHRDPTAAKIARTIVVAKRRMWMRVRRGII